MNSPHGLSLSKNLCLATGVLAGLVSGTCGADTAAVLPSPTITFTSSTFSGSFQSAFLFDGSPVVGSGSGLAGQWAGQGVGPSFVDLDFGNSVTTDCFGYAQRMGGNPALDKAIEFELFFSDTPGSFGASPDVVIDSGINTANDEFTLYPLPQAESGRYVRFQVTGNGGNVGGSELRFYQADAGQPVVANSLATAIGTTTANLNGEILNPGASSPLVTIFYGLNDGGTTAGTWDAAVSLGIQAGAFSAPVTGLLPNRTYFHTARATNTEGVIWASPVLNFTTAVGPPSVINLAASDVGATSATLRAEVADTGGDPPIVTLYYGTTDGGTDAGAWAEAALLGPMSGPVSVSIVGLAQNSTYFFRAFVANAAGTAWAPSSASFTTPVAALPTVVNRPATGINGFSTILHGEVIDSGNDPPTITLFYGPTDGGIDEAGWAESVELGLQSGSFELQIEQLSVLTTYYFRARATNGAGTIWAASSESFTTTDFTPVLVYLNEFLADTDRDADDLRPNLPYCDEDGDPEDWIELYNPGTSAVGIGGYYLTDNAGNLTKWKFPEPTIIPGESFLVVFASNKNRVTSGAELHTNFRIDADGEFLAFVAADGTSILRAFSPSFPPLAEHFSYGLVFPSGEGDYDHFEIPTPGAPNTTTPGQPAGEVVFDQDSQTFATDLDVVLTTASQNAVIRYTTDGTVPTASSTVFVGSPISVTSSTQIRARVFENGFAPGPISSETYLKINPNVSTFTSDLPIVILEGFRSGRPTSDRAMHWTIYEPDETTMRSSPAAPPDFATRGRMRVRGSSSAGWPKYSLSMEAWNQLDEDRNVSPLGLPSESDWILSGRYEMDRALMRNPLIFELSNQIGRYAVRTRFVEVFINTGNGVIDYNEDYMGVYALMEKIKRDGDRVDVERLTQADLTEPEITGGYILKVDRVDPGDTGWTTALGIPGTEPFGSEVRLNHVYPKEEDILSAQRDYIRNYINEFEAAINAPGFTHPGTGLHYREYIDVDSWVDHAWLNILAQNPDALRLSTFMFKPRGGKLEAGPIWDFDRTMESIDGRDNNPQRFSAMQPATDLMTWGWWEQLFDDLEFEQRWIDRWAELRDGAFADENIVAIIDGFASELGESQARNFARWSSKQPRGGSHAAEVAILETWLAQHTAWIDGQFTARPVLQAAGEVDAGDSVSVSASEGALYYTVDGTDPRLPGGGINPTAMAINGGVGTITIDATTTVMARALAGQDWSAPAIATYIVGEPASASNLVVSEIMYHPLDANPPEATAGFTVASDFEYLEIHNPTAVPIDLAGVTISEAFDFAFSGSGIDTLPPGGYALVVRSKPAFEARYGFGLPIAGEYGDKKLSNGGEQILITGVDGNPILDFSYSDDFPWPTAADGTGYSLVLRRPADIPDHSLAGNWRSSAIPVGNPGSSDSVAFTGVARADDDGNGVDDLMDHALGHAPGSRDGLPMVSLSADTITLRFTENLNADDAPLVPQWSSDLVTWTPFGDEFPLASSQPSGAGRAVLVYLSAPNFFVSGEPIFIRLVTVP